MILTQEVYFYEFKNSIDQNITKDYHKKIQNIIIQRDLSFDY